jgi:hypothetical protein
MIYRIVIEQYRCVNSMKMGKVSVDGDPSSRLVQCEKERFQQDKTRELSLIMHASCQLLCGLLFRFAHVSAPQYILSFLLLACAFSLRNLCTLRSEQNTPLEGDFQVLYFGTALFS